MIIVDKKPIPIYESICPECKSVIQYKKSEISFTGYITCPICGVGVWGSTFCPKYYQEIGEANKRLEQDEFGTLAICAIRYCHGRQTYMPGLVRDIVKPCLNELSDRDLNVMIEDCDFQEQMNLYGNERIDKPGWMQWKVDLIAERERRINGG